MNEGQMATQGDRFHIRRSHLFTWLIVAVALFFAGVALGDSDSVGAAEADGVFGADATEDLVRIRAGQVMRQQLPYAVNVAAVADRRAVDEARSRGL